MYVSPKSDKKKNPGIYIQWDSELPPIIEEEDFAVPLDIEQEPQLPKEEASVPAMVTGSGPAVEDRPPTLPTLPSNEERALVLYKPVEAQLLFGPGGSNVSFRVSSDFLHGLKSKSADESTIYDYLVMCVELEDRKIGSLFGM